MTEQEIKSLLGPYNAEALLEHGDKVTLKDIMLASPDLMKAVAEDILRVAEIKDFL
jgi:hypothetical protein